MSRPSPALLPRWPLFIPRRSLQSLYKRASWPMQLPTSRSLTMATSSFHLPGETSRHLATILGFPSVVSVPSQHFVNAELEVIKLARAIAEFEPVRLHVSPMNASTVRTLLNAETSTARQFDIDLILLPTNHLWVRDTGPVYVYKRSNATGAVDRKRYAVDFHFNEWGKPDLVARATFPSSKWPDSIGKTLRGRFLRHNHAFAERVIAQDTISSPVERIDAKLCLEGGALVHDGEGTLIASESSLVDEGRNPGWSRDDVEKELKRQLGFTKVLWFKGMKGLDITDVHADAELAFIRPSVVVMSRQHDNAPDHTRERWLNVHDQVRDLLCRARDAKGRKFEIHTLVEPDPELIGYERGREDPATNYVNFYFVNGGVILPAFGDPVADERAVVKMRELCPDREVRQVSMRGMPLTGGVIHCATQPVVDVESLV